MTKPSRLTIRDKEENKTPRQKLETLLWICKSSQAALFCLHGSLQEKRLKNICWKVVVRQPWASNMRNTQLTAALTELCWVMKILCPQTEQQGCGRWYCQQTCGCYLPHPGNTPIPNPNTLTLLEVRLGPWHGLGFYNHTSQKCTRTTNGHVPL